MRGTGIDAPVLQTVPFETGSAPRENVCNMTAVVAFDFGKSTQNKAAAKSVEVVSETRLTLAMMRCICAGCTRAKAPKLVAV